MAKIRRQFFFSLICVFLFFLMAALGFSQELQPTRELGILKEIFISKTPEMLDVKLIIDAYSFHRVFELTQPGRIVIDLFSIGDIKAEPIIEINDYRILRIRHGMYQRGVARVVFEVEEDFPFYGIERMPKGLKVTFSIKKKPTENISVSVPEKTAKKEPQEKPQEKIVVKAGQVKELTGEAVIEEKKEDPVETKPETRPPEIYEEAAAKKTEDITAEPAVTIEEQLDETKKKLAETISLLNQLNEDRLKQKQKFVRVLVTGNHFSPREGNLKTVYEKGMMFGAELNVGVTDFVELWFAENYFSKTVTDTISQSMNKVYLIPIEFGIKVRLNKGVVNPYFGIGGGYFQYKEETPDGEIREQNIGFIGQSGIFLKIGGFFVVDLYAQFKHCPITTAMEKFDVGGFHFGAGLGFEF